MPNYILNPALRPTVLIGEVMKTIYRPTPRDLSQTRPDATDIGVARETPRAA